MTTPMRLLVLGGTKNLGRHVVETALHDGHQVTLFNRGRTAPGAYPDATHLVGDRARPDALTDGEWDGVIDMSGFVVRDVRRSIEALGERAGHYTFMSSIAVYAGETDPGMTEDAPLLPWPPGAPEDEFSMDLYGPSKVRCEQLLTEAYGERTSAIRTGFVIGSYSPDIGNWGVAAAEGGTLRCWPRPEQPFQYLDARDLAGFLIHVTLTRQPGPFNAVGPAAPMTIADLLSAWQTVAPNPLPVDWDPEVDEFGLPRDDSVDGTFQLDTTRARAAGLRFRSATQTARDYVDWIRAGNTPPAPPH